MKLRLTCLTAGSLILAALAWAPTATAAAPKGDPKDAFISNKCNSCHAIKSQGIAVVEEEGEEADADDSGAKKPPDLSNIGSEKDAAWIKDWLLKKADIDGRKHRKKFEGKPADLDVLSHWLAGLKEPAAK